MVLKEMNESNNYNEFTIRIDFEKGSEHPERVFTAMSQMINAFHELDKNLAKTFSINIDPVLILQDVETGSIKTKLASVLKAVDDDALKDLDWRKAVGSFLVKGKHKVLKFCEDKSEITTIEQVNELENGLLDLAQKSNVQTIPLYSKIPTKNLLEDIARISKASYNLSDKDKATVISNEGEVTINKKLFISSENIEELLTKHIITKQLEMTLLVKKPDYLGKSMWDVQYVGRTVQAKILDLNWLNSFQNRKVDLLPGDSLRALVHSEIMLGENNVIVGEYYSVLKVYDIIKNNKPEQQMFKE